MHLRSFILAGVTLAGVNQAIEVLGPTATLNIVNAVVAPDGAVNRSAVLVNGAFPGPLITAVPTSQFNLNVVNKLTDGTMHTGTSIHWHGIFQRNTTWADGPAFVNQYPIKNGTSFLYQFGAKGQAGTYWYHSHYSTQYCDGLRGPLVIYDPNDPLKVNYEIDDANTVITLGDWYHRVSAQVLAGGAPFANDATLINGLGRPFTGSSNAPFAVINVVKGKSYRLRIVSIACDPNYVFSIDGHVFSVIEVDGVSHQRLTVDSLQIFAGQRYSVVLIADQNVGNYWIRAARGKVVTNNTVSLDATKDFPNNSGLAILRYVGAPVADPVTPNPIPALTNVLNETNLEPLSNPAAPGGASLDDPDVFKLNLNLGFTAPNFTINGVSFLPPTVPILNQIISGASRPQDIMPNGSVIELPKNRVVQISLPQLPSSWSSRWSASHTFSVIRAAGQTGPNFINPVRRDVVSIGNPGDNVTIRFVTDNAGPWFLHCHIDWHLELGFAVVFAEDLPDIKASNPVPQAWLDLEKSWGNSTN